MTRGDEIARDVHFVVIRLSSVMIPDQIAFYTGISRESVHRILDYFTLHGTVEPEKKRKKRSIYLRDIEANFVFKNRIPDPYVDELQEMLSVTCGQDISKATTWKMLRSAGYTLKKMTRHAAERAADKRLDYIVQISQYQANQLVFVDESSADRRVPYRGHAYTMGRAAQRKAFFVRGKRFSVLPALSLENGILHCEVVEGSFRPDTFALFIQNVLEHMEPFPGPNSVIVMDNSRIHKIPYIQELIRARGIRCEFLPPYSPDYNPVELALSWLKCYLRHHGEYARLALTSMSYKEIYLCFLRAMYSCSVEDIRGWYRYCNYF